jgi:GT2 family glycosyltransferase
VRTAVVVPNWNGLRWLPGCLGSLRAQTRAPARVIVVDNGSDLPPDVPADERVVLLANPANRGVAAGRNQGAAAGASAYICFLDSDARLLPDTLRALLQPLAAGPDVALAAPVFTGQAPEASAGRAPSLLDKALRVTNLRDGYRATPHTGRWWDVDFAIGACQLVRREEFMAAGGFDETYFYGPEDVDLCLRLRERGLRVVQVRDAGCHHPPRRRNRRLLTQRGLRHGWAVARHLWRHRHFRHRAAPA